MSEGTKRERAKPVYVGRAGNVKVPVYKYASRDIADGKKVPVRYCVAYRKVDGQPAKRETFGLKKKATDRADEMALAIHNGQADVLELTNSDRDNYRLAVQALAPFGLPLHAAIEEYAAARNILGGRSLIEAAKFLVHDSQKTKRCPATGEIIDLLMVRLADERRDPKYTTLLKSDLTRFGGAFPELTRVQEEKLRGYLAGLKTRAKKNFPERQVSSRRRDNVRDAIVTLFRFAREKEFLPLDQVTAAEKISRVSAGGEVTTYSPAELSILLEQVPDKWMPWLAIASFAGLRTSEIFRLNWSQVKFDQRVIAVPRKIAKKIRISRQVPMSANLLEWLSPWRDAMGPVYPHKSWRALEDQHSRALQALRKATGIDTPNNTCRHSFGSHRLAIVKSFDQVAIEMGTSPAKIRENYNDPKPESEGVTYFGITRPNFDNVVTLGLEFSDPRVARL